MFGIPEWALGVGFIMLSIGVARALIVRYSPPGQLKGKAGRQAIAASVEELKGRLGGVEEVEARLTEFDDVQRRLAEVEERLDFAERLLAQQRDAQRLGPPQR